MQMDACLFRVVYSNAAKNLDSARRSCAQKAPIEVAGPSPAVDLPSSLIATLRAPYDSYSLLILYRGQIQGQCRQPERAEYECLR